MLAGTNMLCHTVLTIFQEAAWVEHDYTLHDIAVPISALTSPLSSATLLRSSIAYNQYEKLEIPKRKLFNSSKMSTFSLDLNLWSVTFVAHLPADPDL